MTFPIGLTRYAIVEFDRLVGGDRVTGGFALEAFRADWRTVECPRKGSTDVGIRRLSNLASKFHPGLLDPLARQAEHLSRLSQNSGPRPGSSQIPLSTIHQLHRTKVDEGNISRTTNAHYFAGRCDSACGMTIPRWNRVSRSSRSRPGRYGCRKNPHEGPYRLMAMRRCPESFSTPSHS